MDKKIQEDLNKIKEALVFIGFTEKEAENQMTSLNNVIAIGIINKIIEENPNENLHNENIDNFIKSKYPEEDLTRISIEVSEPIVKDYFDDITKDLTENKKKYFYKFLE